MLANEDKVTILSLTDLGSVASIIGVVLTILIFLSVRKIKSFYVIKTRVPDLLEKLSKYASAISSLQNVKKGGRS